MNIKELRTLAGMTQQQFSDYFHIPKRTIEDWEAERRKPPVYVVELIEYKFRKEELEYWVDFKAYDKFTKEYEEYKKKRQGD